MTTITLSPKRQLEAALARRFGSNFNNARPGNHRGDWMGLHCGDQVYDQADPRHVGRVESISTGEAKVKWGERLFSHVPIDSLRKVKTEGTTHG